MQVAKGDPWCSCGGLAPDGTFVSAGGFVDGGKSLRYFGGGECQEAQQCDWREYDNVLAEDRWYVSPLLSTKFIFYLEAYQKQKPLV